MPKKTAAPKKAAPAKVRSVAPPRDGKRTKLLDCPKCGSAMQPIEHEGVEIDRCTSCRGLWFDLLEHEDLKKLKGAERIDFGEAAVGRTNDEIQEIDCPVCRAPMLRMVDHEQSHIHFESCATCYGVYFDAGEFKDWKEKNALDWLHSLLTAARK